jgi:Icc-related predicted phosphoesterase
VVREKIGIYAPDTLVVAGDISNYGRDGSLLVQLSDLPLPVLAVRGNSDLTGLDAALDDLPGTRSLHLRRVEVNGVPFVGVSGTLPVPFRSRLALREGRLAERLGLMLNKDCVFVVHPPPWGILDEVFGRFHAGCRSVYDIVERSGPRLVICGHIHERPGTALIGDSSVVNCSMGRRGAGAIIDLDGTSPPNVNML